MNLQLDYSHPHKNPQLPVCLCLISLLVRCGEGRTIRLTL